MNSRITGLRVASIVFGLMFLGQLARLLAWIEIKVGGCTVPVWFSGVAVLFLGVLSFWLWRLSLEPKPAPPAAS